MSRNFFHGNQVLPFETWMRDTDGTVKAIVPAWLYGNLYGNPSIYGDSQIVGILPDTITPWYNREHGKLQFFYVIRKASTGQQSERQLKLRSRC